MRQQTIIELNGKRYNALTGELLGMPNAKAVTRSMDGVVRAKQNSTLNLSKQAAKIISPKLRPAMDVVGGKKVTTQVHAHKPQRSQTLRRQAVAKPQFALKPKISVTAPHELAAKPQSAISKQLEKKLSISHVQPARLLHSKNIHRSHHIQRFSRGDRTPNITAKSINPQTTTPIKDKPNYLPAQPINKSLPAPHKTAAQQLFESALTKATAHEEPKHKTLHRNVRKNHLRSALSTIAAFLIIGGFFGYATLPNIELQVASVRAGFHATLPTYTPNGNTYARDISTEGHTIKVSFTSGHNNFTIYQTSSNLNSSTLADKLVAQKGTTPSKTVQSQGRTIYIYPDGAAWVSNGVEYTLANNASLDPTDVTAIATSM